MSLRNLLDGFFNGRRVLLTGHTGFKGGWMSALLTELGAEVIGLSLPPEGEDHGTTIWQELPDSVVSEFGDLGDFDVAARIVKRYQPDVVLHLAAQSLVRRSYRVPVRTFASNVMGTVHVLEAVRHSPKTQSVVVVTSDKCYENQEWVWSYRESDPMGGYDPYSASKGCAELVTSSYRRSFFHRPGATQIGSARAGNVVGGGDWSEDQLIPDIIRALTKGVPVVLRNPQAVRPWQHVLEPLYGYLLLARKLAEGEPAAADGWNFGPPSSDTRTVREMTELMIAEWGSGSFVVNVDPHAAHEANLLTLDCSKARQLLRWVPVSGYRDAVALTAEWYREHLLHGVSALDITRRQIAEFAPRWTAGTEMSSGSVTFPSSVQELS